MFVFYSGRVARSRHKSNSLDGVSDRILNTGLLKADQIHIEAQACYRYQEVGLSMAFKITDKHIRQVRTGLCAESVMANGGGGGGKSQAT